MLGSSLNYVALRLLGEGPNGGDGAIENGRNWILNHGGATFTAAWGKFWLSVCDKYFFVYGIYAFQTYSNLFHREANSVVLFHLLSQVLGVFDWSGNNPVPPELSLLPYQLPFHPGTYCFLS